MSVKRKLDAARGRKYLRPSFFNVLLTVHLSIFILVIKQFDTKNLFYNKFISCLYMFRAPCAHRQEVKIVLYSRPVHRTATYRV